LLGYCPFFMSFVFSNGSSWMACGVYHIQLSTYVISTSPMSNPPLIFQNQALHKLANIFYTGILSVDLGVNIGV
jgi:hypothetical protein